MPPLAVIINANSGSANADALAEQVRKGFATAGRVAQVVVVGPDDTIVGATQRAIRDGAQTVVAAGGDGTVSTVSGVLAGTDVALGVLPAGTLNHFAKDLGIPIDIPAAIAIICDGATRQVDVGEVNGTVFVNNSSLGLYARLVELRAANGGRGLAKWPVAAWATMRVMHACPTMAVRIVGDGESILRRTPLVFVGNNPYQMQGFEAGTRESLDTGALAIYVVRERSGWRLLRLVLGIIRGKAAADGGLELLHVQEAEVETTSGTLSVAVDGEVQTMRMPLRYRMRAGALKVLAPRASRVDE